MKPRRSLDHPGDEFRQTRMRAQGLDTGIITRQFTLRQRRVDLVVANLVQAHHRATLAAFQLGHKVMQALAHLGRDRALAKRANWVFRQFDLILLLAAGKRMTRAGQKARGV